MDLEVNVSSVVLASKIKGKVVLCLCVKNSPLTFVEYNCTKVIFQIIGCATLNYVSCYQWIYVPGEDCCCRQISVKDR